MQPCFFYLSGVLPADEAIAAIKAAVEQTYGRRGRTVVERNFAAIDAAIAALRPLPAGLATEQPHPPATCASRGSRRLRPPCHRRDAARPGRPAAGERTARDGAWPTGTSKWEKRGLAAELPIWDPSLCIDCGKCAVVCPHSAIRIKLAEPADLEAAPEGFRHKEYKDRQLPGRRLIVQVAPDDCTGCGICADICPARSKSELKHKSLNMEPAREHREVERAELRLLPRVAGGRPDAGAPRPGEGRRATAAAVRVLAGLLRLRRDPVHQDAHPALRRPDDHRQRHRVLVDLRRQPADHALHHQRRRTRPGLVELAVRGQRRVRPRHAHRPGPAARRGPTTAHHSAQRGGPRPDRRPAGAPTSRTRPASPPSVPASPSSSVCWPDSATIPKASAALLGDQARALLSLADELVEKSVWIIGGDGWAYDIGYGGLDHVLSSGRNVNILVLDTEVYSNTGGQASKATPRGATAKFATAGKGTPKKDLGHARPGLRRTSTSPSWRSAPTSNRPSER